ncbi:MAG TPA: alpha/beta fold hydrolase [Chromatiales bacterium]|nr:alpha/beta fold hydrolase [Chromatiales bacterium]
MRGPDDSVSRAPVARTDAAAPSPESSSAVMPRRGLPRSLTALRFFIRALDTAAPQLAGRMVYRLWFATRRFPEPVREARWREPAERSVLPGARGPLALYLWGQGTKTVLLIHGWNGRGTQMGAFAGPLVAAGYRVIAFDGPGHGRSPGRSSSIFRFVDAVRAIEREFGPFHAVVTHSFGALVVARALRDGLGATRVVCISPPARFEFLIDGFVDALQIPPRTRRAFLARGEKIFGRDVWQRLSGDVNAAGLEVPALVIHDENDREVPLSEGQRLAAAWPGAQLVRTRGLGHRRILRDPGVIQRVIDFLGPAR